jgi:hypothetical protein
MSEPSIPAPDDQDKPVLFLDANLFHGYRLVVVEEDLASPVDLSTISPIDYTKLRTNLSTRPSTVDPSTISPIDYTLYSVRTFGFTHPSTGRFLMVPKEFQAILARETNAVAAVIWEIMQQTIGWDTGREPGGLREWARLSVRHFARDKILSCAQAQRGITRALKMGYIKRRRSGAQGYEYQLRWRGAN